jgi:hypothetical protein
MKKTFFTLIIVFVCAQTKAQEVMTPERLWQLGRVGAIGISQDERFLVYRVAVPNIATNTTSVRGDPIFRGNRKGQAHLSRR